MVNEENTRLDNQSGEVTMKDVLLKMQDWIQYLKSKWLILFVLACIGGMIGFAVAFFQKPLYSAELTFVLEDDKASGSSMTNGLTGLASQFGLDAGGSGGSVFSGANIIELMKSRSLVEKALLNGYSNKNKQASLVELYMDMDETRKDWDKKPGFKPITYLPDTARTNFTVQQDSLLGLIYKKIVDKNLSVLQKDKKVGIITIAVKAEDPLFAKYFTESLVSVVSDFYVLTKSKKAQMNLDILQRQTDSIRYELNQAITGVATANDYTYNLNPALSINRVPSSKKQVDVQANTAILTQIVQNLELAKVSVRKETPLVQVIDKPILPLPKDRQSKIKAALLGGFAGFIFCAIILFVRRFLSNVML